MIEKLLPFLAIVFTFGVAIFVHEFGHFISAKLLGIGVDTFSIGFGKKLLKIKRGETTYALGIVPFGGYVQLRGALPETPEQPDDQAGNKEKEKKSLSQEAVDDVLALRDAAYPKKLVISGSGVFFNCLTAIIVFTLIYLFGFSVPAPPPNIIGNIQDESPLKKYDLRENDQILAIDNEIVGSWVGIIEKIRKLAEQKQKTAVVTVKRGDQGFKLTLPMFLDDEFSSPILQYAEPYSLAYIGFIYPNFPADKAGLKKGDLIVAIDNQPIHNWYDMSEIIHVSAGKTLLFKIKRDNKILPLKVTPEPDPEDPEVAKIGIFSGTPDQEFVQLPPLEALAMAITRSGALIYSTVSIMADFIGRGNWEMVRRNVGGPVSIAFFTYQAAKTGATDFFFLFAYLNLMLFLFNILPIPVLDGGHILIATIEKVMGRPIPQTVLAHIFAIMVLLIIGFFIVITFNDIISNLWRFGFKP